MTAFVLFAPVKKHWDEITFNMLGPEFCLVGHRDIVFSPAESAGFREFMHDLYPGHSRKRIERKCDDLAGFESSVRIVLTNGDAGMRSAAKERIRKEFANRVPMEKYITVHSSDTEEKAQRFWSMAHPVNVKFARRRVRPTARFLSRMAKAKGELKQAGIRQDMACVVGGSVLEALGVRETGDIDVVVMECFRERASSMRHLDLARPDYTRGGPSNEDIIRDPDLHFLVDGMKFATLDVVRGSKARSTRKRDAADVALIDAKG